MSEMLSYYLFSRGRVCLKFTAESINTTVNMWLPQYKQNIVARSIKLVFTATSSYFPISLNIKQLPIMGPPTAIANRSPCSWYRWPIDFAHSAAQKASKLFSEPGKTLMFLSVMYRIYCWSVWALPTGNEGGLLMGDSFLVIQIHLHSSQS